MFVSWDVFACFEWSVQQFNKQAKMIFYCNESYPQSRTRQLLYLVELDIVVAGY